VVSLWPVSDVSTALLMGEFYRRLLAGDSPTAALRQAQCYLRGLDSRDARAQAGRLKAALAARDAPAAAITPLSQALARDPQARPGEARPYSHPCHWAPFLHIGAV
jgi:CHAT domain-containing protein